MKNFIVFGGSIAGAMILYSVAFPITAVLIVMSSFILPDHLVRLSIFVPTLVYFLLFFLIWKVKLWIERRKHH